MLCIPFSFAPYPCSVNYKFLKYNVNNCVYYTDGFLLSEARDFVDIGCPPST